MATTRFDEITSTLATSSNRRGALRFLAAAAFGVGSLAVLGVEESDARRRPGRRRRPGAHRPHYPHVEPAKRLRQSCRPGTDFCTDSLLCGAPTTRHTCSDTVAGIANWCCLAQGAVCSTECDCCGDNYCSYDDNNVGHCVPNPEN